MSHVYFVTLNFARLVKKNGGWIVRKFYQKSEKFIQNEVFDLTSQSLRFEFLSAHRIRTI